MGTDKEFDKNTQNKVMGWTFVGMTFAFSFAISGNCIVDTITEAQAPPRPCNEVVADLIDKCSSGHKDSLTESNCLERADRLLDICIEVKLSAIDNRGTTTRSITKEDGG